MAVVQKVTGEASPARVAAATSYPRVLVEFCDVCLQAVARAIVNDLALVVHPTLGIHEKF
jgi:hypothetical protein